MQPSSSAGNETAFDCDNSPNTPLPVQASTGDSSKFNAFLSNSNKLFNNLLKFTMLDLDSNSTCSNNCSGHGECFNNVCFCEVSGYLLNSILNCLKAIRVIITLCSSLFSGWIHREILLHSKPKLLYCIFDYFFRFVRYFICSACKC